MEIRRNLILNNEKYDRAFLLDLYYQPTGQPKPVIIFVHGFKGFKDWGHWDLIGKYFAQSGFVFLKFNFSHNGTTLDQPTDFTDLEAFGNNNYSKELADIDTVLNWLYTSLDGPPPEEVDLRHLCLIGHSRGGPVCLIKANLDDRVTALISWASVSTLDYAWPDQRFIDKWQKEGVYFIQNARTKQQMPLYYQLYEDFQANRDILDTAKAARQLHKPYLIIHGTSDPAISADAGHQLHEWANASELFLIEGADHVFGGAHPYLQEELPEHTMRLVKKCENWLSKKFS